MSLFNRLMAGGAMIAALAGCTSLGQQEPQRYYVLEGPAGTAAPATKAAPRPATLLVAPATAASFYETQDIVFSRAPGLRAYYQYNSWAERPSRRITELVTERLERAALFKSVSTALSGVRGDLVLNLHLAEFYHDAAEAPGWARIALTAELLDPARRILLARRTFEQSAPAASHDAPGAVRAFNHALAALLDDLAGWLDASAPR
jgi:cholesterol transport system auxiliary component